MSRRTALVPAAEARRELDGVRQVAWSDRGFQAHFPPGVRIDGVRRDGVEVRVVPRPFSTDDLVAAGDRLTDYLDDHDLPYAGMTHCVSGAGLVLETPRPQRLERRRAELEEAAGVRVRIVVGYATEPA